MSRYIMLMEVNKVLIKVRERVTTLNYERKRHAAAITLCVNFNRSWKKIKKRNGDLNLQHQNIFRQRQTFLSHFISRVTETKASQIVYKAVVWNENSKSLL